MPNTPIFNLPVPAESDPADVPTDLQELADRLELLLLGGTASLPAIGDIKWAARSVHHGRWLKLDGSDRTQAEVETALGMAAGGAAAFATLMGTGAGSFYGAAAAGKIRIPDARRRMPLSAGPTGDGSGSLSVRAPGGSGGEERHLITATEAGIKSHAHTASQAAHAHTLTDPGHTHGASQPAHSHATSVANHTNHSHEIGANKSSTTPVGGANDRLTALTNDPTGNEFGYTGNDWDDPIYASGTLHRNHTVTNPTAQPAITVTGTTTGITMANATPAVTVASVAGADADQTHENMPPFLTIGFAFIRV